MRLLLLILSVCLVSCVSKKGNKNAFQVIELNSKGEVFNMEKKSMFTALNFVRIAYQGDYRLYIVPILRTYTNLTDNPQIIHEPSAKLDTLYEVFALRKGDKKGLKYALNNFKNEKGIVFDIDSVKEDLTLSLTDKDFEGFSYDPGSPTEVVKDGKTLIEKFAIKKVGSVDIDSLYRYYNEDYKDIDFSFSNRLDQQKNSKLYKIQFIYNVIPKGVGLPDMAIPRREFFYGMVKVSDKRTAIFNEILEKFKRDKVKE